MPDVYHGIQNPGDTPMRDILRAHLFPEVTVKQNSQIKIMDIQQEILARNIGDGHRVIHGVAGSGKTMILLFRCLYG